MLIFSFLSASDYKDVIVSLFELIKSDVMGYYNLLDSCSSL